MSPSLDSKTAAALVSSAGPEPAISFDGLIGKLDPSDTTVLHGGELLPRLQNPLNNVRTASTKAINPVKRSSAIPRQQRIAPRTYHDSLQLLKWSHWPRVAETCATAAPPPQSPGKLPASRGKGAIGPLSDRRFMARIPSDPDRCRFSPIEKEAPVETIKMSKARLAQLR